jgi:hypothetical protein
MSHVDSRLIQLAEIASDSRIPIQATESWAHRGVSVATGIAGIRLALFEQVRPMAPQKIEFSHCTDIFSSSVTFEENQITFLSNDLTADSNGLGDLFMGVCNQTWTDLVFNRFRFRAYSDSVKGEIIRPGLGHGELARDLARWLASGKVDPFYSTELQIDAGGWCNGSAGALSALCVEDAFRKIESGRFKDWDELIEKTLDWSRHVGLDAGISLCHGITGALVSLAATSRIRELPALAKEIETLSRQTIHEAQAPLHTDDEYISDISWLTGVAGCSWATAVIDHQPALNPIVPTDSLQWN